MAPSPASSTEAATAGTPFAAKPLLTNSALSELNQRRLWPAWRHLLGHGALLLVGGGLWGWPTLPFPLRLLGLSLLGWGLAFSFCAMHECAHRTAFLDRQRNDTFAWWFGVLSFYNADFYRRYHQWHHRHTHQPGLDPELEDPPPTTRAAYLLELSGLPWWLGKLRGHWRGLRGDFRANPYIPPEATARVQASIQRQFAVYGALLLLSLPAGNGCLLWFWLLPLLVGQPLLRFVLLAEHGGCPFSRDGLANTRTTLTLAPLRWLMWNMPYHAEHHLYPSLPFDALPRAHALLAPHLAHGDQGYLRVHRDFLMAPHLLALPPAGAAPSAPSAAVIGTP
ncbi:MAG: fatty acid desaturase [Cyanobacteriota bacterium]|nr:fatty acid desaturase [Cyanobacteriota bacterium]